MKPLKSVPEWLGPLIEREEWLYGMREEGDCVLYYSVTDYEILFEEFLTSYTCASIVTNSLDGEINKVI